MKKKQKVRFRSDFRKSDGKCTIAASYHRYYPHRFPSAKKLVRPRIHQTMTNCGGLCLEFAQTLFRRSDRVPFTRIGPGGTTANDTGRKIHWREGWPKKSEYICSNIDGKRNCVQWEADHCAAAPALFPPRQADPWIPRFTLTTHCRPCGQCRGIK